MIVRVELVQRSQKQLFQLYFYDGIFCSFSHPSEQLTSIVIIIISGRWQSKKPAGQINVASANQIAPSTLHPTLHQSKSI